MPKSNSRPPPSARRTNQSSNVRRDNAYASEDAFDELVNNGRSPTRRSDGPLTEVGANDSVASSVTASSIKSARLALENKRLKSRVNDMMQALHRSREPGGKHKAADAKDKLTPQDLMNVAHANRTIQKDMWRNNKIFQRSGRCGVRKRRFFSGGVEGRCYSSWDYKKGLLVVYNSRTGEQKIRIVEVQLQ